MKRLWPKLSTSIRPKTSVRPDATMKMIIPIARPATVSVNQVDDEPTTGQATSARTTTSATGTRSKRRFGIASAAAARRRRLRRRRWSWRSSRRRRHWCAASERPSRRCCSASSSASSAIVPRWTTRPSSITATRSPSARATCEVLLDQQHRRLGALQLAQRGDQVERRSPAPGPCSARRSAAGGAARPSRARSPASASARPRACRPGRARTSSAPGRGRTATRGARVSSWSRRRAERAASSMFSATVRSAKMPMFSGT